MKRKYYVYRFINVDNVVIYVGKSKEELPQRFSLHLHLPDSCYKETHKIEYIECPTEADMSIKEIYYINKYYNEKSYNVLDVFSPAQELLFHDEWLLYDGALPEQFKYTVNYVEGLRRELPTYYNKDGSERTITSLKKKGVSSEVFALSDEEVKLIAFNFINNLKNPYGGDGNTVRYLRNIVILLIGIHVPLKVSALLELKYKDVYDKNNKVKPFHYKLNRSNHDVEVDITYSEEMVEILEFYRQTLGYSFELNSEDWLFPTRENKVMRSASINRILMFAAEDEGIEKNLGGETLRKTYGLHIYNLCDDKLEALAFIEAMFGHRGSGSTAKYLGLICRDIDYERFLSEHYQFDLSGYMDGIKTALARR